METPQTFVPIYKILKKDWDGKRKLKYHHDIFVRNQGMEKKLYSKWLIKKEQEELVEINMLPTNKVIIEDIDTGELYNALQEDLTSDMYAGKHHYF